MPSPFPGMDPPQPPLPEPDAAWARELLAARLLPDTGNPR